MSSREETIKHLEESIRDFKQFCGNQDRKKVMNAYAALDSLYATLDLLKEQKAQRDYEASVEMAEYCERYEQTYNPDDGSM